MKEIDPIVSKIEEGGSRLECDPDPYGEIESASISCWTAGRWTLDPKISLHSSENLVAQFIPIGCSESWFFIFLLVALGIKLSLHEYTVAKISSTSIK